MEDALAWVLPNIVAIISAQPERTIFTLHPPKSPDVYYERWASMTIDQTGPDMVGLVLEFVAFVPPATVFDKHVYSSWTGSDLHQQLRDAGIDTSSSQDVCVYRVAS
jgi:nicotinamidase-related amidase